MYICSTKHYDRILPQANNNLCKYSFTLQCKFDWNLVFFVKANCSAQKVSMCFHFMVTLPSILLKYECLKDLWTFSLFQNIGTHIPMHLLRWTIWLSFTLTFNHYFQLLWGNKIMMWRGPSWMENTSVFAGVKGILLRSKRILKLLGNWVKMDTLFGNRKISLEALTDFSQL